jgi:hypothetical protein
MASSEADSVFAAFSADAFTELRRGRVMRPRRKTRMRHPPKKTSASCCRIRSLAISFFVLLNTVTLSIQSPCVYAIQFLFHTASRKNSNLNMKPYVMVSGSVPVNFRYMN